MQTVAVPGYVYWADETVGSEPPVGFGLFRAAPGGGYELWLAGLDNALRGKGHGRAMLKALFATPTGQQTRFMRVRREGGYANAVAKLLAEHGFTATRETKHETWFVRAAPMPPVTRGASILAFALTQRAQRASAPNERPAHAARRSDVGSLDAIGGSTGKPAAIHPSRPPISGRTFA